MKIKKQNIGMMSLVLITAILITVSAIVYKQAFFKTLPLYISLVVLFFKSDVRRIAPLIGSFNSILYAIVDFSYGLYGTALSDILISFTLQFITFILWTRRKDGKTTRLRKLRRGYLIGIIAAMIAIYIPCLYQNMKLGASVAPLDTYCFVDSLVTPFLTMFAFIEYTYFSVIGCALTIVMNTLMLKESPDRLSYVIYSVYSTICCIVAVINVHKIYKRQTLESTLEVKNEA